MTTILDKISIADTIKTELECYMIELRRAKHDKLDLLIELRDL
jgi:hypothetical protein